MTAPALPARWTDLPRDLRDAVLGKLLARRLGAAEDGRARAPIRADRSRPVPLSLEQLFVFNQWRRTGGQVAWTLAAPPIILDDLDVDAVRRAVTALARRHDVLHMTIREEGGRFVQVLNPDAPPPLTMTKLPLAAALTGAEAWIRRRYDEMLAEPFDPASGPLWRAELVSRAGRGVILMTYCSLVADGESLRLVDADLRALYAAERAGAPAPDAPAFDYADHAAEQAENLAAGRLDGALAWWGARLADFPADVRTGERRGVGVSRLYEQGLGSDSGRALAAAAAVRRTTPLVVILTEFTRLLRDLDGSDEVAVSIASVSRDRPDTQTVVGSFARLVPLCVAWPRDGDPLAHVGEALMSAMDREPVPTVLLEDMLDPGAASAPFRYIVNHRLVGDGTEDGEDGDVLFRVGPRRGEAPREEDILLMVLQSGDRYQLHWYLRADRFAPEDAEQLLRRFHDMLRTRIGTAA